MMRLIFLILGILLILEGYAMIVQPRFYSLRFHRYLDFSDYNLPFGILMIIVGLLFVGTEFRKMVRSRKG